MKRVIIGLLVFTLVSLTTIVYSSEDFFPLNKWFAAQLPAAISGNLKFRSGKEHTWYMPVLLEHGKKYTLSARWHDGEPRMASVIGFDPLKYNYPSGPKKTLGSIAIVVSGNKVKDEKVRKINFTVSNESKGNVGYVVFTGKKAGQNISLRLSDPAESDKAILEPVKGRTTGKVSPLPLFIKENKSMKIDADQKSINKNTETAPPANETAEANKPGQTVSSPGKITVMQWDVGGGNFFRPNARVSVRINGKNAATVVMSSIDAKGKAVELQRFSVSDNQAVNFDAKYDMANTRMIEIRLLDKSSSELASHRQAVK